MLQTGPASLLRPSVKSFPSLLNLKTLTCDDVARVGWDKVMTWQKRFVEREKTISSSFSLLPSFLFFFLLPSFQIRVTEEKSCDLLMLLFARLNDGDG
jgi:hypothetical protein